MTQDEVSALLAAALEHKWFALAIVVIGLLVRLTKDDTRFPLDIPSRWHPVVVVVLGQAYAVLQAIAGGVPWPKAVGAGLLVALCTMGLFDLVVKAFLNGRDLPPFLRWVLKPDANPAEKP